MKNKEIDLHDRIYEAYNGKLGKKMQEETQKRMHWIRDNVIGDNILDIGCSQGIGPILLSRIGKKVLGIDISQKAVDEALQILSKEDKKIQENVTFKKADFFKYDKTKQKFDTITITEVLEHLYNPEEFIAKAKDLLVDNGRLIVTVPFGINDHPDHKKTYYYHDIYTMLINNNFDIEEVSILGRWIGFIACKKNKKLEKDKYKSIPIEQLKYIEENFYKIERLLVNTSKDLYDKLQNCNQKYRELSKLNSTLKEKLEDSNKKYTKTLETLDYKDEVIKDYKQQIDSFKKIISNKNYELEEYKKSASYQLGYLLLHKTRSFKDLIKLPKRIMDIREKKIKNINKKQKGYKEVISLKANIKHSFSTNKKNKELKIACIMDTFTYNSYLPEANFMQLTPQNWEEEINSFSPDMLFIESAWKGKDELWWNSVGKRTQQLVDIVKYCNDNKIPTIFWNKEDPVHFDTFINTAGLFDFVFTTDIDMINKYKMILKHNNIHLLPFACQPQMNNPIEKYQRKDAFCFAGAYYTRYPERTKDLEEFMLYLPKLKSIEIYDRNFEKNDPLYAFPKKFKPFIVGTLPFNEIDKAYKGYKYAINLNSVKQSQSMFARRIYELLASNTLTVSNFSKAVRLLFGDLVITSDNGKEIVNRIKTLISNESKLKKQKLIALRKVMQEHTYTNRLDYITSIVFNKPLENKLPKILVISFITSKEEYERCVKLYEKQTYSNKELLIILEHNNIKIENKKERDKTYLYYKEIKDKNLTDFLDKKDYISLWHKNDYYGKDYLTDLALATKYFDGDIIGKKSFYEVSEKLVLNDPKSNYIKVNTLPLRTSIVKKDFFGSFNISKLKSFEDKILEDINGLSIDEFNYCKNGLKLNKEDLITIETNNVGFNGISINKLEKITQKEQKELFKIDNSEYIIPKELINNINLDNLKDIKIKETNQHIEIISTQPTNIHQNIYNAKLIKLDKSIWNNEREVYLDADIGLYIQLLLLYYNENKKRIAYQSIVPNKNEKLNIPDNTKWIQFGLRVKGSGSIIIKNLFFDYSIIINKPLISQSEHLVLTNIYPSYEDIYRNGFVHARVKAYKKEGVNCDVFVLQKNRPLYFYEFENIDVTQGDKENLDSLLQNNKFKSILVHFLNEDMWEIIKNYINNTKVYIWVHGSEIQPWHRRTYNYSTEEELNKAKKISEKRIKFWKNILTNPPKNLKLIFVSNYFKEEVEEDLNIKLPKENVEIIHNFINTSLFEYIPKQHIQRKKILSIRPFASNKYANDLSIDAILELSKKTYFNELEFYFIGDGILFDETIKPIKHFSNVKIKKGFLTHSEIAKLHKEYGIFLVPTRMDSQGVSRDEAMSSGLVPITNKVAAIPEFVDESCGILAREDNAKDIADGIAKLYEDPNLFLEMSQNAANRVRKQSGYNLTILKEIELFNKKIKDSYEKK